MKKIFFDNFNETSNSGPNSFGKQLKEALIRTNEWEITENNPDIQLSFIEIIRNKNVPIVLRLDGIYHNSTQDYNALNAPIKAAYQLADAVIIQSNFDKQLIETFFGQHKNSTVIRNGIDLNFVDNIKTYEDLRNSLYTDEIYCCASSWRGRGHKRLKENIRYFMEHSKEEDRLLILGPYDYKKDLFLDKGRIFWFDQQNIESVISIMKISKYFIHLAWLDHCPNVVIQAIASGCHSIVSNSGGTSELLDCFGTIIRESEAYNMQPCDLYNPPALDFSKKILLDGQPNKEMVDINFVVQQYIDVFNKVLKI